MNNFKSQFKTLIQDEMQRLERIVAQNEASEYPVPYRQYANAPLRTRLLKRQPSIYHATFLSRIRNLAFMSFFL